MKEIMDEEVNGLYEYLNDEKKSEKLINEGECDQDYIQEDLDKKYPEDKYFVLLDYIDNDNNGYFRIRVWEKWEHE